MKISPRRNMVIGRMTIRKVESTIILTGVPAVTKFILVDAVGPDAAAAGIKVGDLVVAKALGNIVLDSSTFFVPMCEEENVIFFVEEVGLNELSIQTKNGKAFVPFDSEEAAPNISAPARVFPATETAEAAQ